MRFAQILGELQTEQNLQKSNVIKTTASIFSRWGTNENDLKTRGEKDKENPDKTEPRGLFTSLFHTSISLLDMGTKVCLMLFSNVSKLNFS